MILWQEEEKLNLIYLLPPFEIDDREIARYFRTATQFSVIARFCKLVVFRVICLH